MLTTGTLLLSLFGCFGIVGNGDPAVSERSVGDFENVAATHSVDVDVYSADEFAVTVYCDSNLIGLIETEVEGDTLTIGLPPGRNIAPRADCYAEVLTPVVFDLTTSGSGHLYADGDFPYLHEARSTGSGGMTLRGVASDFVALTTTGSGGIEASGEAGSLDVNGTGSGAVDAKDLASGDTDVRLTGSGGASVQVYGDLHAVLTGSGSLDVYGDPLSVTQSVTGSGDVDLH
jgi:hypothetical protein